MNSQSFTIDNTAFAKRGDHLSGHLAISSCQRLLDFLQSQAPDMAKDNQHVAASRDIDFLLTGELDAMGRYFLHLEINAALNSHCQRCLDPMTLDFKLGFHYLISDEIVEIADNEFVDDNDDYDLQEPNQAMNILSLIEDELIMAMPIAPTHDFDCAKLAMHAGDKPNPFAALKSLIKP
jgi:uncharacterized protein